MNFIGQIHKGENSGNRFLTDILEGLAHKKAQHVKFNQNRQLLQSLGLDQRIAANLAHKDDKTIFDFLKQIPGLEVGAQNQAYPPQYQQGMEGLTQNPYQGLEQVQNQALYNQNQYTQPQQSNVPGMVQGNGFPNQQFQQPRRLVTSGGSAASEANEIKRQAALDKYNQALEKQFKPTTDQFAREYKVASEMIPELENFIKVSDELSESGKEWGPAWESFLEKIANKLGIDLRYKAGGPTAESLRKITAKIINIGSAGLGARSTNLRVNNLMKQTPSLLQSPEGRKKIAQDWIIGLKASQIPLAIEQQIRAQNNGNLPKDFNSIILPMIKKAQDDYLDQLSVNPSQGVTKFSTEKEARDAAIKQGASGYRHKGKVYKV